LPAWKKRARTLGCLCVSPIGGAASGRRKKGVEKKKWKEEKPKGVGGSGKILARFRSTFFIRWEPSPLQKKRGKKKMLKKKSIEIDRMLITILDRPGAASSGKRGKKKAKQRKKRGCRRVFFGPRPKKGKRVLKNKSPEYQESKAEINSPFKLSWEPKRKNGISK